MSKNKDLPLVPHPVRYDQVTLRREHFEPGRRIIWDEDFERRFQRARLKALSEQLQSHANRDRYAGETFFP